METATLQEKIEKLPPERLPEVIDFVESLLEQAQKQSATHLRMTWAGGLKEFRNQYTALELQKKSLEWWGD
ncbi:MAG: DUF2281 domain-containing protein [Ignavibacteriales bacterium]|nr:DUF2281 domain-containing protein [Ignavibacteriales bacterium]